MGWIDCQTGASYDILDPKMRSLSSIFKEILPSALDRLHIQLHPCVFMTALFLYSDIMSGSSVWTYTCRMAVGQALPSDLHESRCNY